MGLVFVKEEFELVFVSSANDGINVQLDDSSVH